jgi:glycosyltransferase involved in cell wall biosynthesis
VNFTKYHSSVSFKARQNKIVMVANLVEVKGAEILLNAFLKANLANWTCTIVGDNTSDYATNLTARFAEYSNVVFTGKVSNVNDYLSESKIFVLPTLNNGRKEGFPGATLEAMSNGMVVLGSNICGIRDQMEEQFSEFLFTAGDVDDLSKKLKLITKYSDFEMDKVGRKMRSYVLDNFSIKREVDELVNLFNKIL